MTASLCILCCHNFEQEVGAGVTAEGWTDVVVAGFPANCGRPPLAWDDVRRALPEHCSQVVVVLGNACLAHLGQPPDDFPPLRLEPQGQCFHLIAGPHLVDDAMAGGGYLISPAWLEDWRGQLRKLGFEAEQAGEFFHDFASELVLLDTRLDAEIRARLRIAGGGDNPGAPAGGRPRSSAPLADSAGIAVATGTGTARRPRAEPPPRRRTGRPRRGDGPADPAGQNAERGGGHRRNQGAVPVLFAPAALYYLRLENDVAVPCGVIPDDMLATLRALPAEHAWTPDGQGFLLRISHGDEKLGLLAVDRLAFPAYRERYLNMALAVTGVCGLAIENARNRRRLLEAEKMASLSILVAGVAYEINTPLGVSLAAAGVELAMDCAPELEIDAVAGDWASILGNLIGNSLKHGFKDRRHGRIDIRVARLAKSRLCVDYLDDGLGMAPEVQARIFDPFFPTDLQQGMGLGLHLVYNLITQRMGGSIRCDSAQGQGAHFQIELPLAPPAVSPAPTF